MLLHVAAAARRLVALAGLLFVGVACHAAWAQAPAPPAMTQEQIDALVEATSSAVIRKLREEGAITPKATAPAAAPPAPVEGDPARERLLAESRMLASRVDAVWRAYPELWRHIAGLGSRLDRSALGERGAGAFWLLLAFVIAGALGAEWATRRALQPMARSVAKGASAPPGPRHLAMLTGIDIVPLLALVVVAMAAVGWWFQGEHLQASVAGLALSSLLKWRAVMFAMRAWLRDDPSGARLAPVDDDDARRIYRTFSMAIAITIALRGAAVLLADAGLAHDPRAAAALLNTLVAAFLYTVAVLHVREPMARWFAAMKAGAGAGEPLQATMGRRWLAVSIFVIVAVAATHIYSILFERFGVSVVMLRTLATLIALLLAETLLSYVGLRLAAPTAADGSAEPRLAGVFVKCLRVLIRIAVAAWIVYGWMVGVFGMEPTNAVHSFGRTAATIAGAVFVAYVAWEIAAFVIKRHALRYPVAKPGADMEDGDDEAPAGNASRLGTLLPVARVVLALVIAVLTILVVLKELGVDTTPLIAGASVLGLAVSFGSQALVRDIVSGIFFLADDAFRVGEYLDVGKVKGTVEGFTLRSIRLRHQNGQIHTLPFGQLGQITNFSRDWTTVKFNLRFARDTDIEKMRKLTKKIGMTMMAEPEFKRELLQPLKMQGVADIADNALIVRFKFTCRPIKPTYIQRQAIKRMFQAFPAAGIEFARNTIDVRSGATTDPAALAGAASATAAPAANP